MLNNFHLALIFPLVSDLNKNDSSTFFEIALSTYNLSVKCCRTASRPLILKTVIETFILEVTYAEFFVLLGPLSLISS